jgi:hypothetical protein
LSARKARAARSAATQRARMGASATTFRGIEFSRRNAQQRPARMYGGPFLRLREHLEHASVATTSNHETAKPPVPDFARPPPLSRAFFWTHRAIGANRRSLQWGMTAAAMPLDPLARIQVSRKATNRIYVA